MLAIALLVLGIFSRLIIHIPNFTPIIALTLFGAVYLSKKQAIILPLFLIALTDLIIGFHEMLFFTWGSILLVIAVGFWLKDHKTPLSIFGTSVFSAILFFIISNFGVWLIKGFYPLTIEGLIECYVMALPFFRNTLLSTLIYALLFFGAYEFLAHRIRNTRFAKAL